MSHLLRDPFFVRNVVYGLEDSVISTTGVVVGVTFAGLPTPHILVAAIILILVESSSMAFGAFLADKSFVNAENGQVGSLNLLLYALAMFLSYIVAGVVVILPYLLRLKHDYAYTVAIAVVLLFGLVWFVEKDLPKATAMTMLGVVILIATIVVGRYLETLTKKTTNE